MKTWSWQLDVQRRVKLHWIKKHFKFDSYVDGVEAAGRCDPRNVRQNRIELGQTRGKSSSPPPQRRCCVTSARSQRRRLANFVSLTMALIVNVKKTTKKTISIWFVSSSSPLLPPSGKSHLVSVPCAATLRWISTGKNSIQFYFMGNKLASRCGRMSNARGHVLPPSGLLFVDPPSASCEDCVVSRWFKSLVFRLRTKLAESWPAPPPPPSAIFLFQSHNKREKGEHLATPVDTFLLGGLN